MLTIEKKVVNHSNFTNKPRLESTVDFWQIIGTELSGHDHQENPAGGGGLEAENDMGS